MNESPDIWQYWPLSVVTPKPPDAIALRLQVGAAVPSHFDDAIRQCSITGKMVCIVWTAPTYVVLERVEPVTDIEERAELSAMGKAWQRTVHQTFDVIPTVDVAAWSNNEIEDWYNNLQIISTEKALCHFAKKDLPLFVIDDSISNEFPSSVLFSVARINWVHTMGNRRSVMDWTEGEFAQLISATMLGAQMSQKYIKQ